VQAISEKAHDKMLRTLDISGPDYPLPVWIVDVNIPPERHDDI
jgi:hypothetical protein